MVVSACFRCSQIPLKNDLQWLTQPRSTFRMDQISIFSLRDMSTELVGQRVEKVRGKLSNEWNFVGGSRIVSRPNFALYVPYRRSFGISASWFTSSQIATCVFTLGTAAVLPFYTLMVLAPKAKLTKRLMESKVPYVVLGLLYAYLLYLSWTPDTIQLMFASKYWLPELHSIAKMFSSEMTLASAWIHLLGVDLFAASEVFHDGLENGIEMRHSVSLCLFFCPIGILTHIITKTLTRTQKF